jgi:hypothetical protein
MQVVVCGLIPFQDGSILRVGAALCGGWCIWVDNAFWPSCTFARKDRHSAMSNKNYWLDRIVSLDIVHIALAEMLAASYCRS